jgi:N-acetylmuramoyl-L-alanine amidase
MSKVLFLDAGHGGVDPKTNKYTTAPGKMFTHKSGVFHNGSTFYEGVSNRFFAEAICKELVSRGITVVKTYHEWKDTGLAERVDIANTYHKNIQEGVFLSLHSDASNGTAEGLAAWTSEGQTLSDVVASQLLNGYNVDLKLEQKGTKLRKQTVDGDWDYEKDFYVLKNTKMPAVLIENLFFDNIEEATLLMNCNYQKEFINSTVNSLLEILK